MSVRYMIQGGRALHGRVSAQGLPGAAIAGMAAALLTTDTVTLTNVPHLSVLDKLLDELRLLGVAADWTHHHEITIKTDNLLPMPLLTTQQLLGKLPLLVAAIALRSGVCRLELRQAGDLDDVMLLAQLSRSFGGLVEVQNGLLRLAFVHQHGASLAVTGLGSEAALLSLLLASQAEGVSEIEGVADDPKLTAMVELLQGMGASISQTGESSWRIQGAKGLRGTTYRLPADRMEVALFGLASLITGGDLLVQGVPSAEVMGFLAKLQQLGASYRQDNGGLQFWKERNGGWQPVVVEGQPFPGIGLEWLPLFVPLLVNVEHEAVVRPVTGGVMAAVDLLRSLGGEFYIGADEVRIFGPVKLVAGKLKLHGIADGLAGLLTALSVPGQSELTGMEAMESQFEHLSERLLSLGAALTRMEDV